MILFKCGFCRRQIKASDDDVDKKIACPFCSNQVFVPAPSSDNQQDLMTDLITEQMEAREDKDFFDLRFTEVQLFSMSLALLILYSIDSSMRRDFSLLITRLFNNNRLVTAVSIIFLIIPFSAGLFFTIYHAFRKVEKSWFEKSLMLFFAIIINAGTGLYLSWYVIKVSGEWWLLLFAVWNIIYSILLIFKFQYVGLTDSLMYDDFVSDVDATIGQVLFAFIMIIVVLAFCRYRLELFWIITYSICITSISFSEAVIRKILARKSRRATV